MLAKKTTWSVVVVLVIVSILLVGQSVSQPGQKGQQGQKGQAQGGIGGEGFDPARMRQAMEQIMQRMLRVTDTKWKVLGPLVMKVVELNQVVSGGVGMMMGGGFGGGSGGPGGPVSVVMGDRPGGRGPASMNRELTEVEKARQELQTTLDNTAATPDAIKKQLTTLRAAKEKVKQELAKAQQDLRKVLTLRQEATLVLMGMLD